MKIALIAPPWCPVPPILYGGIEIMIDWLARGLQAKGHDVLLVATADSTCPVPTRSPLASAAGDRIGSLIPEALYVAEAYDAVAGCDLVHDHTILGPLYVASNCPLPVVTTIHGNLDHEMTQLYRRISESASVVGISAAQVRAAPAVPVRRVIHHGVDAAAFAEGPGDGGYFLFLGRMSPDKGAHRAMEAAWKAGVPLLLAGKMREPAEHAYFDEFVGPYLNDSLQYLGEVDDHRKLELLRHARGLLFPIRWNEPFGLVMIEALACGTPVLAYPEGAAPEVVRHGETGFLCDGVEDMAEAIARIDEIDRRGCRASAEGYFSSSRMTADHVELYEEVLSGRA